MLPETPAAPPSRAADRRLVLVAGAGRSGTSTVAGILRRLGLHVPQPEVVSDETNPKGFGEPRWVVDFHDDLLRRSNVQVSDARPLAWERSSEFAHRPGARGRLGAWLGEQLDANGQLIVKDPRLSWFLPLWTAAAREQGVEPSFLTMLRPPAEVVGSKRTYYNDQLQDGHGVAAWLNMLLNTERATRGSARTFVRYHDLLADWEPAINRITADLELSSVVVDETARADISGFVDPGLRRINLTWADLELPTRLEVMAREAWTALDALATDRDDADAQARLDEIHGDYNAYYLESEVVSRSSVIAVRQAAREQKLAAQAAPGSMEPAPVGGRAAVRALGLAAARRTPRWARRMVPASARARARARLGG